MGLKDVSITLSTTNTIPACIKKNNLVFSIGNTRSMCMVEVGQSVGARIGISPVSSHTLVRVQEVCSGKVCVTKERGHTVKKDRRNLVSLVVNKLVVFHFLFIFFAKMIV